MQDLTSLLFRRMLRIRLFEEYLLTEFSKGMLSGTTHAYIGQEAVAVGLLACARPTDLVFSNHRCHGHFLACGGDMFRLAAELMGKDVGICGGRGGSQHLCSHGFYSNGIQGGIVPCAAGMALAQKVRRTDSLVIVFLGDGTLGEGVVYETLNIASLWRLPILFVVENNHYAQTTPIESALAGSITARFDAFGIKATEVRTSDVLEIMRASETAMAEVRQSCAPVALVFDTYRFCAHSKGDDTRDPEEVAAYRQRDCILVQQDRLPPSELELIRQNCVEEVERIFRDADAATSLAAAEHTEGALHMFE